jgi:hypothetical protein
MAPNRDQVKGRIKTREQDDPELDDALQSARDLSDQENLNKKNELERNDKVGWHLHRAQVIGIYVVGFALGSLFLILVWHYGAATDYRFLSPEQLAKLQQFLFTGTVGTILGAAGRGLFK